MENVMPGLFVCSLVWEKHERRPKSDLLLTLFNFSVIRPCLGLCVETPGSPLIKKSLLVFCASDWTLCALLE